METAQQKYWRRGYARGLTGQYSNPPMFSEIARRAFENGYDVGRAARHQERKEMDDDHAQ